MEISQINPDGNVYDLKDATARADIAQIKAQDVYATEETDTGKKWIDGKTIYRIVKNIPSASMSGTGWHGLLNEAFVATMENVINCALLFTYEATSNKTMHYPMLSQINGQIFRIYNTAGFGQVTNGKLIIEYTKI